MSDEPPKSAGALIVEEAREVIPRADRELAGRGFGAALANMGDIAAEVSFLVRAAIVAPRAALGLFVRVGRRLRGTPREKLVPPTAQLLLGAASGFASTTDEEVRSTFENLLVAAVNTDTASRVHPAFVSILKEMTPVEARIVRQFAAGAVHESYEAFAAALDTRMTVDGVHLAMANLRRLELVSFDDPASFLGTKVFAEPAVLRPIDPEPGHVFVHRLMPSVMTVDNKRAETRTKIRHTYLLTTFGSEFLDVVLAPKSAS